MQKRKNPLTWSSFAFCQTKAGLVLRIKAHLQARSGHQKTLPLDRLAGRYCDPDAWAIVEALPDFFPKEDR